MFASGMLAACCFSTGAWGEQRAVPLGFYGGAGVGLSNVSVEVDDGGLYGYGYGYYAYDEGEDGTAQDVHDDVSFWFLMRREFSPGAPRRAPARVGRFRKARRAAR